MDRVERLLIVGLGLIGTSFGLLVHKRLPDVERVGLDPAPDHRREALARGAIGQAFGPSELAQQVARADLILLAAPPRAIGELLPPVLQAARAGARVMDVASTKAGIVRQAGRIDSEAWFVGGHPIAGSERQGPVHAGAELLAGAVFTLSPHRRTPLEVVSGLSKLLANLGLRPLVVEAELHDRILARTSHLVQVTASVLADSVWSWCRHEGVPQALAGELLGSGFRDTTRLADSDPALWQEILADNQEAVTQAALELAGLLRSRARSADWTGLLEAGRAARQALLGNGEEVG